MHGPIDNHFYNKCGLRFNFKLYLKLNMMEKIRRPQVFLSSNI